MKARKMMGKEKKKIENKNMKDKEKNETARKTTKEKRNVRNRK